MAMALKSSLPSLNMKSSATTTTATTPPARPRRRLVARCCETTSRGDEQRLGIGSPVILVEAPPTLKTAASMPTLKVNAGLVKPGDVGRIVARKPKDVWAVRLTIGTYLIEGKHFKPLDLDE